MYVSGRVRDPGRVIVPQGASLNQALDVAGGAKFLNGGVEFVRFMPDGEVDRRSFRWDNSERSGGYKNPILMAGDIVRLKESPLSASMAVIDELASPVIGIYSFSQIFGGFLTGD